MGIRPVLISRVGLLLPLRHSSPGSDTVTGQAGSCRVLPQPPWRSRQEGGEGTWEHPPTSQLFCTSDNSAELWVHVSAWGPLPPPPHNYNKFSILPHPFDHISWLSAHISLFHNMTSPEMGCGRTHLTRLQPAAGVMKRVEGGPSLRAGPLFFPPTPKPTRQGNSTLS